MALRSKLKRVQLGSKAQQKAAAYSKPSNVRSGTYSAQQKAATPKPFHPTGMAGSGQQGASTFGPQPAPAQAQAQAQPSFWQRAKTAGFSETLRRGLNVGKPEPARESPSKFETYASVLPIPAGAFGSSFSAKGVQLLQKTATKGGKAGIKAQGILQKELNRQLAGQKAVNNAVSLRNVLQKQGLSYLNPGALTDDAAKAAMGWRPGQQALGKFAKGSRFAMNTKVMDLTKSFYTKMVAQAKSPYVILGAILGYPFTVHMAANERGDAATSLDISMRDLAKARMFEEAEELKELIDEITDPGLMTMLKTFAPVVNYPISWFTKWKATRIAAQASLDAMRKEAEDEALGEGEDSQFIQDTQAATDIRGAEFDRQRGVIEEYGTMTFERKQAADQEMQQFWQSYLDQKQTGDEEARQFWADYQANKQRYWEEYQKSREDSAPSQLGFGLL